MNTTLLRDFQKTYSHSLMNSFPSNKSFQTYLKCVFVLIIIIGGSSFLSSKKTLTENPIRNQTKVNAFIISNNCTSTRFTTTKQNIERVFPDYFTIHCYKSIPLNDPRISQSPSTTLMKFASLLITFVTLWTEEIPKYTINNDLEWSFTFEDDVNFIEPSKFTLTNYINVTQELMNNEEIRLKDGMFYLGICGPIFVNNSRTLISSLSNNSLMSRRGYGYCTHAMAFTTKRAKTFWAELSLVYPIVDSGIDLHIHGHGLRGGYFYTLGGNAEYPLHTGHYGIAFQDRAHFYSEMG